MQWLEPKQVGVLLWYCCAGQGNQHARLQAAWPQLYHDKMYGLQWVKQVAL
jgi:hypothetical protein